MEINETISIGLVVLAAIFNAMMDLSADGKLGRKIWNKKESWHRKWKRGNKELGERFWGSSRWFVFLTDFWHFSQFLFHSSWQLAIAIQLQYIIWKFPGSPGFEYGFNIFLNWLGIKTIFSALFQLFYKD